jgi:putative Flp pilus-assembly TadE/G-like protein
MESTLPGKNSIYQTSQRGQASVFVMLFMIILVVSAIGLYKSGKLTSNKMRLQNAADAAAFSMSTVEARDLNFAAYMNRAIVANEVAIGQMIGLASWGQHIRSIGEFIDTYNALFLGPATLGASTPFVQAFTRPWQGGTSTLVTIMNGIANIGTTVIHNINKIYGGASFGYHTVSILFAVGVLDDVIVNNGPPGTKLSDFGIVTLIAHVMTYGVLPNQFVPNAAKPYMFASGYLPSEKMTYADFQAQDSGYARLAALIRDSRDPFTKKRGWEIPLFETLLGDPIDEKFGTTINIPLGIARVEIGFEVEFAMEITLGRYGGSELRLVVPSSTTGKKKYAKAFNWSAADTTQLALEIMFALRAWATACVGVDPLEVCGTVSAGGKVELANDKLVMYLDLMGFRVYLLPAPPTGVIPTVPPLHEFPFPTNYPFSAGFAEAGKATTAPGTPSNNLGTVHMRTDSAPSPIPAGPVKSATYDAATNPNPHYGAAGRGSLAWYSPGPGPIPPAGILSMAQIYQTTKATMPNKSYSGLPHFVDTTGNDSMLGVGAPNLIIALVQDESDFDSTTASEPGGRFQLNEALADGELAVMAKSELYFSRPTDRLASHFQRGDGLTEYGNAFNPYWQARLVETTYADRIMALLIQQKEDYMNLGVSLNNLLSAIPFP